MIGYSRHIARAASSHPLDRLFPRVKDPRWQGVWRFLGRDRRWDDLHVQVAIIVERLSREEMPQDDIAVLLDRFLEGFLQVFRQTVAPGQRVIPRLGVAVEPHLEVDGLFFAEAGAQHRDFIDMAAQSLVIRRFRGGSASPSPAETRSA